MCGEKILSRSPSSLDCLIAYIGLHYVMDCDYDEWSEPAMTILQFLVFKDERSPATSLDQVDNLWQSYCQYKHSI